MCNLQKNGVGAIRAAPSSGKTVLLKTMESLAKKDGSSFRYVYMLDMSQLKDGNLAFALQDRFKVSWDHMLIRNRRCRFSSHPSLS